MADLPPEMTITINALKQKSLDPLHKATAKEFALFENFGKTEQIISFFEDLMTVAKDAKTSFTRLNDLQLQIAEAQPIIASDMIELLTQAIARIANKIPACRFLLG